MDTETEQTELTETGDGVTPDSTASSDDLAAQIAALTKDRDEWKRHSRENEARAKENAEKAKAYDSSQEKSKTLEERLASLEAERNQLASEKERNELVSKVSKATGVPSQILNVLSGADEQSLTEQANLIIQAQKKPSSVVIPNDGLTPDTKKRNDSDQMQFVRDLMAGVK